MHRLGMVLDLLGPTKSAVIQTCQLASGHYSIGSTPVASLRLSIHSLTLGMRDMTLSMPLASVKSISVRKKYLRFPKKDAWSFEQTCLTLLTCRILANLAIISTSRILG